MPAFAGMTAEKPAHDGEPMLSRDRSLSPRHHPRKRMIQYAAAIVMNPQRPWLRDAPDRGRNDRQDGTCATTR